MIKYVAKCMILSLFITVSLFFTSCSYTGAQTEDMVGQPKISGSTERLLSALSECCCDNFELVYPLGGMNIIPVNYSDINGDGCDEVLVFYRDTQTESGNRGLVNIAFFSENGEDYDFLFSIQSGWYDIEKFELSDIDGDGMLEFIVGFQNLDTDKRLSVYSINPDMLSYTCLRNDQYTDWVLADINNDGIDDVIMIYNNVVQKTAMAIAYKPGCGKDENILDYAALGVGGEFYKITKASDSAGMNYVIISSKQSIMLSSTEILCWDPLTMTMENISYSGGRAENPFGVSSTISVFEDLSAMKAVDDSSVYVKQSEVFQSPVENLFYNFCSYGRFVPADITGDGLVEFPMYYEFDEKDIRHAMSLGKEQIKYRYSWYRFETNLANIDFSEVYRSIYHNYVFKINKNWNFDRMYAIERNDAVAEFYYFPEEGSDSGIPLADKSVLMFRIGATSDEVELEDNIIPLAVYGGLNFYIEINTEVPERYVNLIPERQELKEAFVCEFKPSLINVFDSYISEYHNYVFKIDDSWDFDNVAVFENYNKDFIFYYVAESDYLFTENSEMKIRLFEVKSSATEVSENEYIIPIAHVNNLYYYIEINGNLSKELSDIVPSAEELKEAFVFAMISAAE